MSEVNKFDVVISMDVIEHFNKEKLGTVVESYYNLLNSEGFAVIGTPNIASRPYASQRRLDTHEFEFTRDEFEKTLREEITISQRKQIDLMKTQLELKANNRRTQIDRKLQTFTLKQLSEFDRQSVCSVVTDLVSSYNQIKNNLAKRSENNIVNLIEQVEESSKKLGLFCKSSAVIPTS